MINFLAVGGDKYGVGAFTKGSKGQIVSVEDALQNTSLPLCWAGSHKVTLLSHCLQNKIKFYNLDSGYFGNGKLKNYKRISINNYHDTGPILDRPGDRLSKLNLNISKIKQGSKIALLPPDYKKADAAKINIDDWTTNTILEIKKYSDRDIVQRIRPTSRDERTGSNNFLDFLRDDIYCVVGYQSNALVESLMHGIPVISTNYSAINLVSNYKIKDIEQVNILDDDLCHAWLRHLSYRQFTEEEMLAGIAWELLSS